MRLVEPVAGELLHQVEEQDRLGARQAVLLGPGDEHVALLRHLFCVLLAHRAAQEVRAAERVAPHHLRDLHHLLLVHHDPVGGFQDRLQARIEVFDPLAVLALDELGDELHRPGAVQRDERDDVLEAVGPRALDEIAHAARFELEYRGGVGVGEHRVGVGIVERDLLEREVGLPHCADRLHRPVEDGEGGEAEEVELHQADALDVFHVELRDRALGPLSRVERAEIGELARGD